MIRILYNPVASVFLYPIRFYSSTTQLLPARSTSVHACFLQYKGIRLYTDVKVRNKVEEHRILSSRKFDQQYFRSSPVRILWITHPHHGQSQQSRSSRHSSGRARSGSDSTTIRGNPTAASEVDLLQQPQGGRKCCRPLWRLFLRLARLLVQRLCKPLVDLRRFSALPEVDRDLLTQAVTRGLQANPTCLLDHPSSLVLL